MVVARSQSRRRKIGAHVVAQLVCVLWLFVIVNGWIFSRPWRSDWNERSAVSITGEVAQWIRRLEGNVEFVIPYTIAPTERGRTEFRVLDRARRAIKELSLYNPQVKLVDFIHVAARPTDWDFLRNKYQLDLADCVYVIHRGRRLSLPLTLLATVESRGDGDRWWIREDRVVSELVHGVRRLLSQEPTAAGWAIPGGERPDSSRYARILADLARRGVAAFQLDLNDPAALAQAERVIVTPNLLDPDLGFTPAEAKALADWGSRGGRVLLTLPPEGSLGLESWLASLGWIARPGLVAEPIASGRSKTDGTFRLRLQGFDPDHPITKEVAVGASVWEVPFVRAWALSDAVNASPSVLVRSSEVSWIELASVPLRSEVEPAEPLPVVMSGPLSEGGRIVVMGVGSALEGEVYRGVGRRVILNALAWLGGEDPSRYEITPDVTETSESPDGSDGSNRGWAWIPILPLVPLALGAWVYWRRGRE